MEDFDADLLEALLAGAEVKCPGAENNTPPFITLPQGGVVGGAEGEGESRSSVVGDGSGANAEGGGDTLVDDTEGDRQVNRPVGITEERRSEPEKDPEQVVPDDPGFF